MSTPRTLRILILEDQSTDADLMLDELHQAGFAPEWRLVNTEADYLAALHEGLDLILADYTLPSFDALQALYHLQRRNWDIPFIVVTGTVSEAVAVECMRQGAADYLLKDRLARLGQAVIQALRAKQLREEKRQAAIALRESAEFNRVVLNSLTAHIAVLNRDGKIVAVNESWTRFAIENDVVSLAHTGIGSNYLSVCQRAAENGDDDAATVLDGIQSIINRTQASFICEYSCHSPHAQRWFLMRAVPLVDGSGEVVVSYLNITDRKRAEAALEQEVVLLRTLIDNVPDYIYVKDNMSRFLEANRATAAVMGVSCPEELYGKSDSDFYPSATATQSFADERKIIQLGESLTNREEPFVELSTGQRRWLLTTKVPLRDSQGTITGLVGIGRDITERKLAEEALRQSEAAEHDQRLLAEALRDTVATLVSSLDPAVVMAQILANVGRVVPHDWADISLIDGDSTRIVYCRGWSPEEEARLKTIRLPLNASNTHQMLTDNVPLLIPDTDAYPGWVKIDPQIHSFLGVPIRVHGIVVGFLKLSGAKPGFFTAQQAEHLRVFANQTAVAIENAQLYDELRRYASRLEQRIEERTAELQQALGKEKELSELKDRFTSMISHEFRTPLTVIRMSTELMANYPTRFNDERKLKFLKDMLAQVQYITELLDDVLTIGKAQAGKLQCHPLPTDAKAFSENTLEQLQLADAGKHRFVFTAPDNLPRIPLDQRLLRHILVNLLSNAIKYSPDDSEVYFGVHRDADEIVFQVRDQGIGIPKADQAHLFEAFHRAQNAFTIQGTGLGLTVVKANVEAHGGTITFDTQENTGTTFTVRLPAISRPLNSASL